jgi:hypothetical protein
MFGSQLTPMGALEIPLFSFRPPTLLALVGVLEGNLAVEGRNGCVC